MKFAFVVLVFRFAWGADSSDEVSEYEAIINKGIEEAEDYQLPTDNKQYKPQNEFLSEGKEILFNRFCLKFNF